MDQKGGSINGVALSGIVAFASTLSFFFGILITDSYWRDKMNGKEYKPGTYVDAQQTANVLCTVGMHALNDGLYDEYELEEMLQESCKGG